MRSRWRRSMAVVCSAWLASGAAPGAMAYSFNQIVPDVRQPASLSGGSACPVRSHQLTAAGSIALRWSTALASYAPQARTATQNACGADGVNSICFDQADMAFTPGVLAFTRVVTADRIGAQLGSSAASVEVGEILDADIYFNPGDSRTKFATPGALPGATGAYDLESLLTHELGHLLGFSHSAVWSAMMFPFAPAPGTFSGKRPTQAQPDAPLAEDDRTGLRVLYPDASDLSHLGSIAGRVIPANPLSLPLS